jgi:hypothetical protein
LPLAGKLHLISKNKPKGTIMVTLASRVKEFRVTGSIKFTGNVRQDGYWRNQWKVVLRNNKTGKQYTFPMFTGDAFGEPTITDALNCIVVDAQCWFNANSFQDFCEEFGYDSDSISHRKIYDACGKAYENLMRVFGYKDTKALLFDTESL